MNVETLMSILSKLPKDSRIFIKTDTIDNYSPLIDFRILDFEQAHPIPLDIEDQVLVLYPRN